nr:hypothetical protein [uncultured Desulfobacter sp.]
MDRKNKKDFGAIPEILVFYGDPTGNRTRVSGVRVLLNKGFGRLYEHKKAQTIHHISLENQINKNHGNP